MIFLRSLWYRLLHSALLRGRVRIGRGVLLLRPELIKVERGGLLVLEDGAAIAVGARIVVRSGATLTIRERAYVGPAATLVAHADVTVGRRALIAERVSIHSEDHGPAGARDDYRVAPVVIGDDTWLCAGVVVSKGSTIGDGTTVGANAFVRGDLPPRVLAAGAPAKVIKALG